MIRRRIQPMDDNNNNNINLSRQTTLTTLSTLTESHVNSDKTTEEEEKINDRYGVNKNRNRNTPPMYSRNSSHRNSNNDIIITEDTLQPNNNTPSMSKQNTLRRQDSNCDTRESSKQMMMQSDSHWILHELTYPSETESQPTTLKQKIWLLFEDPTSSKSAEIISVSIMSMILISGGVFLVETIPENGIENTKEMYVIELFFVICFTIEYVIRICSCPDVKKFLLSFLNAIDLFAFLPFYIEQIPFLQIGGSATPILRVLRLTRVFRIVKVSKYVGWIKVFTSSIKKSIRPLCMLLYIMFIGIVLCSTAIYFIEKDVINPQTQKYPFESIPSAFWWSIVTMTTVGYGDAVPQTPPGKLIGAVTSLCGILVLALPITVISSNFNHEMEKMERSQENSVKSIQRLRKLLTERYSTMIEEKKMKHMSSIKKNKSSVSDAVLEMSSKNVPIDVESEKTSKSANAADKSGTQNGRISMIDIDNMLRRDTEDHRQETETFKLTQNAKAHFDATPYLTNEDIRGILACHIVGSLVTLIEKEERLLMEKTNKLIRKQFDFLMGDISRIFSEIPHFQGLNVGEFKAKLEQQRANQNKM